VLDILDWEWDLEELRYRFSGVTSLALALVFLLLPYDAGYTLLRYVAAMVFLFDALVKFLDLPYRELSSALYSFFLGISLATFFRVLGDPLSLFFGLFFMVDAALKLLGYRGYEYRARHVVSAVLTVLLGLSVMFGVLVVHPCVSLLFGFLITIDGLIKLEYLGIL